MKPPIPARPLVFAAALAALVPLTAGITPTSSAEFWQKSVAAERSANYEQALKDVFNYKAQGGDPYLASLRAAWLSYQMKDYAKARVFYEAASKAAPGAVTPLLGLANTGLAEQNWKTVESAARAALRIDPGNYTAALLSGQADYNRGDFAAAARAFERVAALYPEDPVPLSWLAWCKLNQDDKRGAKALFERILVLSPDYPYAQQGLELCTKKS
jgi:tetratricopeptide (TPR) repeat protein